MGDYTQLSLKERRQMSAFLDMNYTVNTISQRLNRHRSTIYRELKRNHTASYYLPVKAHLKAQKRRLRKPIKLIVDSPCYKYVLEKLKLGWSPEQISGRMRRLCLSFRICHETIYQYIYRHARETMYRYLPCQRRQRKMRYARYSRAKYGDLRSIANRPEIVETRSRLGDWEGDTIRFAQERKASITTLVERKSRFVLLRKNICSTSQCVMQNIVDAIYDLPMKFWKTITFDQGSEFANCVIVESKSSCKVFYAHAHSPWLRGTNENTNKRLRRYLPRNTKVKEITQDLLNDLGNRLNRTPRKCLGYLTPMEVFSQCKKTDCRT